jgi:hypothetical protein
MWNWFNCYLSGRHDFGVSCEDGAIFLRCPHCGKRSHGFLVDAKAAGPSQARHVVVPPKGESRVLPFARIATR